MIRRGQVMGGTFYPDGRHVLHLLVVEQDEQGQERVRSEDVDTKDIPPAIYAALRL